MPPKSMSPLHLRGLALAVLAMLVLSPDGMLVRLVEAGEWQLLFWRGGSNALALTLFLGLARPGGLSGAMRAAGWAGLACSALIAAGTIMYVASLARTTVANTLLVLAMVPLFGAVLGLVFLREGVPLRTWLAIAATLAGMAVIFAGSIGGGGLLGDALAAGTALCMAGALVIIRANPQVSMLPALALSGVFVSLTALAMADPFDIAWRDIGLSAIMGVVQQAFAIGLFLTAARYLPPAEAGLVGLVETVLGPLWVWLAVGETPGETALLGGAIVLLALAANFGAGLRSRAYVQI